MIACSPAPQRRSTEDHILHDLRWDPGALRQRGDHGRGELLWRDVAQDPAEAPDGCPQRFADDCVSHEPDSIRWTSDSIRWSAAQRPAWS
jgi:hypothetical protein